MSQLLSSFCPCVSHTSPTSDVLLTKGQRPLSATRPVLCIPSRPQSAGRRRAAIRGIHYMPLHLSELIKNRERHWSPLRLLFVGRNQAAQTLSIYLQEGDWSLRGMIPWSSLPCFPLKQMTSVPVTSTHLFCRIQLPSGPTWMKWDANCWVTRPKGPGRWTSPPFSPVTCSSVYSSNAPTPFPTPGLCPWCSPSQDEPPLISASPAPPQQASPNWNDTHSEEAPLTGLLSNLHSTLRIYHNTLVYSLPNSISYSLFVWFPTIIWAPAEQKPCFFCLPLYPKGLESAWHTGEVQ